MHQVTITVTSDVFDMQWHCGPQTDGRCSLIHAGQAGHAGHFAAPEPKWVNHAQRLVNHAHTSTGTQPFLLAKGTDLTRQGYSSGWTLQWSLM
jgi:hypothetical protein